MMIIIPYLEILILASLKAVECLNMSSFVSSWNYMEANSYKSVNITHNMNSLPVKVEVQVKATDGSNKDFIFLGTSAAQNDDDESDLRGGVIYIYNEKEVILFSGFDDNARLIYTGSSANRIGPNVQASMSGLVRARVWSACDFPKPDFLSDWFDISSYYDETNLLFQEVNHNLGVHPAYVSVQIQILEGAYYGYYFDATGTCMVDDDTAGDFFLHHAGVLYAYNETTVRIWAPQAKKGFLFGLVDGWGTFHDSNNDNLKTKADRGKARILAWKSIGKTVMEITKPYGDGNSLENYEIPINRDDNSKDILVSVEVQAKDGNNKGFRFPGTGAAMENPIIDGKYGGIIYSFNQSSIRIWRPSFINNNGFIAFVGTDWGGFFPQASNAVDIVFKVWELQVQENSSCAYSPSVLTIGGYRCACCDPEVSSDPYKEIMMNLNDTDQCPPDSVAIQRFPMSSLLQCSNMCLYNKDCTLMSFNNEQCILYNQTAISSTFISHPGVQVWIKDEIN